jgi:hypothetical protein
MFERAQQEQWPSEVAQRDCFTIKTNNRIYHIVFQSSILLPERGFIVALLTLCSKS